jgi:hypothetical protein
LKRGILSKQINVVLLSISWWQTFALLPLAGFSRCSFRVVHGGEMNLQMY